MNICYFSIGTWLNGSYHGVPFTGKITTMRQNTANHRYTLMSIALDKPITVYGTERQDIMIDVDEQGRDGPRTEITGALYDRTSYTMARRFEDLEWRTSYQWVALCEQNDQCLDRLDTMVEMGFSRDDPRFLKEYELLHAFSFLAGHYERKLEGITI